MPKPKNTRLSVFKGREAKLNRAIFESLSLKGPQTIYDVHKHIRTRLGLRYTRYASVNKRVKALEKSDYIKKIGAKRTRAGFQAIVYELTGKAYLSILLNSMGPEDLIAKVDEITASMILAVILGNI